jgi:hypothetical protein
VEIQAPSSLTFQNLGAGQLLLNWNYGTLQSASTVGGPYSDLSNAAPPLTISATNGHQYYRLRLSP